MREKYSTTHVKSDIGDVIGTSAIARQSNVHSCKRGMFDHCFDSVFISSLEKVVVFVASLRWVLVITPNAAQNVNVQKPK